jgi:single-stranded-DNA-specific exonuclease
MEAPESLPGMVAVRDRILHAIRRQQPAAIYADYDADGVLSAAILATTLRMLGADVSVVLPRRDEGYGLSVAAVKRFAGEGKQLVITVDNGISALEPIRLADRLGLDVAIIDHHQRQEQTPAAAAILWEPRYCASGLAMMTAWALLDAERGTERAARTAESLSKLAAIATIADCIPLFGAGRTLTQIGLANLARNTHAGLSRLLEVSGIQRGATPTSRQIGFMLAPRLNSAGRMGSPNDALAVFLEPDPAVAIEKVNRLDELNSQRRELQKSLCKQMIEQTTDVADVCVTYDPDWPHGLVGIMAARAAEHFGVPAFVLGLDPATNLAFGSARSVPGFDLVAAMRACSSLLVKYGGHAAAAGVTLKPEHISDFREALAAYARTVEVGREVIKPETHLDLREYTPEFEQQIRRFEPFGIGNPAPVFRIRKALLGKAKAYASTLTQGKQTVRVRHGDDVQLDFTQVERDYVVEATTRGLVLQGVAQ